MKRRHLVVLMTVTLAAMGSVRAARADAAPPPPPPAGSVETGEYPTMVQMESENVIMTIADDIAYVKATFNMRNQGTKDEAFDVRFPIDQTDAMTYSMSGEVVGRATVYNFAAYVDGKKADVIYASYPDENCIGSGCLQFHWATWHVTFPAGLPLTLGVIYQVDPYIRFAENYQGYSYVLHTGAGWFRTIGKGTITVRLPYEANDLNTIVDGMSSTSRDYTTSGTDMVWEFTDLEPTVDDDINIDVMSPQTWRAIQSAQREVEEAPDSPGTHLKLAHALLDAMANRAPIACFAHVGDIGEQMLAKAEEEYQQALEIAPNNVDIYVDYIGFLGELNLCGSDRRVQIRATAQRIWQLDPGNEELLARLKAYDIMEYLTPIPTRSPTHTPGPTWTPGPTLTEVIQSWTLAPKATVTLTSIPIFTPDSSPTTPPLTLWAAIGAVVIGGAGIGVWAYRRNRSARK